jgi:uncharacterized protein (DUF1697 family)
MSRGARYAAFLRAINVGGRRVSGEDLRAPIEAIEGVSEVATFLASGNLVLTDEAGHGAKKLTTTVEQAIADGLGFKSEVFLRSEGEIATLAAFAPFSDSQIERSKGKPQVILYATAPTKATAGQVLALATTTDPLVLEARELHWLPSAGTQQSDLDLKAIDNLLGPGTMRTRNTIVRMRKKFFA